MRRAHAIRARLSAAQPADQRASRDLAESTELLGGLLVRRGAPGRGVRRLDEALALRESSLAADPESIVSRSGLCQTLALRAAARRRTGAQAGAVSDLRRAVLVGDALASAHGEVPELGQRTAALSLQLADTLDAGRRPGPSPVACAPARSRCGRPRRRPAGCSPSSGRRSNGARADRYRLPHTFPALTPPRARRSVRAFRSV